jgi:hypothetical protein
MIRRSLVSKMGSTIVNRMADVLVAKVYRINDQYVDGTPNLEISLSAAQAVGQAFVRPEPTPVTVRVAGRDYSGHVLAHKAGHERVAFSPTLGGAGGERTTLGRVLSDAGFGSGDTISLAVTGSVVEVLPADGNPPAKPAPAGPIKQKSFFEALGAPLHNPRWSWGAVRPSDGAVILRVWSDEMRVADGRQVVQVTFNHAFAADPGNAGFRERAKHVALLLAGSPCLLVMCDAVDPAASPRKVKRFDSTGVYRGGGLVEIEGGWWVEKREHVPFADAREQVAPAAAEPTYVEGKRLLKLHRVKERDPKAVSDKKAAVLAEAGRLACEACGFDFYAAYGARGKGFAECHHRRPISQSDGEYELKLADLAVVCANCHRMLHRRPWVTVEELQAIVALRLHGSASA